MADTSKSADSAKDWLESEEGRARVITLLNASGAPLEARIARLAQRLVTVYDDHLGMHVSAQPLVYGDPSTDIPMRQIDRVVSLYQEIELTPHIGIQLMMDVLIEAKYRQSAQFFGIPVDKQAPGVGTLPIAGDLIRSSLVRDHVAPQSPEFLRAALHEIAMLNVSDKGPQKYSDEQLIYKATGSLYDCIRKLSASWNAPLRHNDELAYAYEQFEHHYKNEGLQPLFAARPFIISWAGDVGKSYAEVRSGSHRLYYSISIFAPVICVDGPLYKAELDGLGEIQDLKGAEVLLSSARLGGWPPRSSDRPIAAGPEAVVTLTNVTGLQAVLKDCVDYFARIASALQSADSEVVNRSPLEHDFLHLVDEDLGEPTGLYRSDLDGDWG